MSENKKLTFASVCMALCFVLPLLTGEHPEIAAKLCLMHFPVMVCGTMCGAPWGVAVGVTAPILRSLVFGMPVMYPDAVAMCLEIGTYGLLCGLLAEDYCSRAFQVLFNLLVAVLVGRFVWAFSMMVFAIVSDAEFSLEIFRQSLENTWAGVVLQLIILPPMLIRMKKFLARKKAHAA